MRPLEGITVVTNLHTLDTARNYCERIVGMAGGCVVFDGKGSELTAEAVKAIYGTDRDGAGIDETMTSTSINPAPERADNQSAGTQPLALAGL